MFKDADDVAAQIEASLQKYARTQTRIDACARSPAEGDLYSWSDSSWSCVIGLASALRIGLIELGKNRLAVQGKRDKMDLVCSYLTGQEFQQQVAGVIEAFVSMQDDLESEKRSMKRIWSKRDKQLQRALTCVAGMYGDLQGIMGASMPVIDGLELPRIELRTVDPASPY
jgi:hypothetical protein